MPFETENYSHQPWYLAIGCCVYVTDYTWFASHSPKKENEEKMNSKNILLLLVLIHNLV